MLIRSMSLITVVLAFLSLAVYAGQTDGTIHGKVTNVIEASGYTYVEVDINKQKVWAAGPNTPLKIGDMIGFSTDMVMENFHSKSMNRDFDIIYFVDNFIIDKTSQGIKTSVKASPHSQTKQQPMAKPVTGIAKAEGGHTIAEIYADKINLNGKTIRVRGLVSKFNGGIMGKNWLHIRDSSTHEDLTITTDSTVAVNDIVIVEARLSLDKDFNYGYFFPLILEDATITKE